MSTSFRKFGKSSIGYEIFVPKIPSFKVTDLALAIKSSNKHKYVGIRPEKKYEEMINSSDSKSVVELKKFLCIMSARQKITLQIII